jgi:hypothetical protein
MLFLIMGYYISHGVKVNPILVIRLGKRQNLPPNNMALSQSSQLMNIEESK